MVRPVSARPALGTIGEVLVPLAARGPIVRRQRVSDWLERLDADRRAVTRLEDLRARHGEGPIVLHLPGRTLAIVVSPEDARTVLDGSPQPFATANREKRAALARFEPHGVLISRGLVRTERRGFNERALDTQRPIHHLAGDLLAPISEAADSILRLVQATGTLTWSGFADEWCRLVRRLVLGDGAREDRALIDLLAKLRSDGNWAYLKPYRRRTRAAFLRRLQAHVDRAEPGSLAAAIAGARIDSDVSPADQVAHWLFAFDAAGMASFTALALIDAHPGEQQAVRAEVESCDHSGSALLPRLRACVLESLRLWPTTPAILRDTTTETTWRNGTLPAGSAVLIYVPYFHRNPRFLPQADRFTPDLWLEPAEDGPLLLPFSAGPAVCPGRNLVLMVTSTLLAHLLRRAELRQALPRRLSNSEPLPATLSPFGLRFECG
jgi:cytochrome P450